MAILLPFQILIALVWLSGVSSQVVLTQSASVVKKPGESHRLQCTPSGFSLSTYAINWIRQEPGAGKGLEWLVRYFSEGNKQYASTIQGRFIASKDSTNSYLQMNSLKAEDTAVYYCARDGGSSESYNWFDYWGQGTMVTVTSANPAAPVLFPLRPCCDHAGIDESVTIGCLATDFLPDSLTLTWNDQNNASISSAVKTFPSVSSSSGTYSTSTQVSVPGTDWNAQLSFYCLAKHSSGNKEQKVQNNKCLPSEPFFMTLHVPSKENFEGSYRNSTIICQATKVHTRQTTIQWLKDGAPLQSGFATQDPVQDGSKYAITSELTVIDKDWNANHLYSCIVKNDEFVEVMNTSKAFEAGCRDDENEIMVEVIPPPFADIFISKSAKLTCRVRNMVTTDGLSVTWVKKNGKELETTVGQRKIQENGLYAVEATATTCADEWERGDIFICKVSHPDVIFPIEKPLQKENKGARHAPSIYVLPPPSEQLALREGATVTCLVKGFFPQDFFVNWLQNGEPIGASKYITREPVLESKQPELFFTYSTLNINEQEWSAGNDYTCVVGHEALPLQVAQKTVDKTTGKPTSVNVSLVLSDTANTCY